MQCQTMTNLTWHPPWHVICTCTVYHQYVNQSKGQGTAQPGSALAVNQCCHQLWKTFPQVPPSAWDYSIIMFFYLAPKSTSCFSHTCSCCLCKTSSLAWRVSAGAWIHKTTCVDASHRCKDRPELYPCVASCALLRGIRSKHARKVAQYATLRDTRGPSRSARKRCTECCWIGSCWS